MIKALMVLGAAHIIGVVPTLVVVGTAATITGLCELRAALAKTHLASLSEEQDREIKKRIGL